MNPDPTWEQPGHPNHWSNTSSTFWHPKPLEKGDPTWTAHAELWEFYRWHPVRKWTADNVATVERLVGLIDGDVTTWRARIKATRHRLTTRARKDARQIALDALAYDWTRGHSPEVIAWASGVIDNAVAADNLGPYVHQRRLGRIGHRSTMRRYWRIRGVSGPGNCDWLEVGPDGRRYRIGFGHGD